MLLPSLRISNIAGDVQYLKNAIDRVMLMFLSIEILFVLGSDFILRV